MQGDSTARRSEGRFFIDSQATRVTITSQDAPEGTEPIRGRLADLSLHGCKLAVHGKINPGTPVVLHIEIPSIRLVLDQTAIVRWQQPRDASSWWTGCELTEPFKIELVDQLANAQILNRRRDPRYPVGKIAHARWELSDEVLEVELVNFSKGGFCVIFPSQPETIRERLLLLLDAEDHEVTVPARVMWSGPVGERYAVGCAFGNLEGFVEVRTFADITDPTTKGRWFQRRKRKTSDRPSLSKWIPISLLVLAMLQGSFLLRRDPEVMERGVERFRQWMDGSELRTISIPVRESSRIDSVESELQLPEGDPTRALIDELNRSSSSR